MAKKERKPTSLLKRATLYLVPVLLLTLLIIFLGLKIKKETDSIVRLRSEIEEGRIFISNLVEMQKEEKEAKNYEKILKALIPDESNSLSLAYQAKYLAKRSGVDFNFNFLKQEEDRFIINFSLTGSQENVLNFLRSLRKALFFLSLEKFNWSKDEKGIVSIIGQGAFIISEPEQKTKSK